MHDYSMPDIGKLICNQENDGQDLAQLFRSTRDVLQELPWDDEENIDVNSLSNEVDELARAADAELQCKQEFQTYQMISEANSPSALCKEIESTQAQISNQFAEYQNLGYRLYAVFVHRGSVSFGHYWIYIYDFNRDIWRKYNDEYVTEVQNLDEIFKNTDPTNPPTPYFLVYINDKMKDRLVDPVCRDIAEPMPDVHNTETGPTNASPPTETTGEDVHMDQSTD